MIDAGVNASARPIRAGAEGDEERQDVILRRVVVAGVRRVLLVAKKVIARAGLDLANAAVVGLLLATLYEPVFTSSVFSPFDLAWGFAALALLLLRTPPWLVVLLSAASGAALSLF